MFSSESIDSFYFGANELFICWISYEYRLIFFIYKSSPSFGIAAKHAAILAAVVTAGVVAAGVVAAGVVAAGVVAPGVVAAGVVTAGVVPAGVVTAGVVFTLGSVTGAGVAFATQL